MLPRLSGLVRPEPTPPGAITGGLILGTAGNDRLAGGAGNEKFFGAGGNDQINGGAGTDMAIFTGAASGFDWRLLDDGVTWRVRDLDRRAPQVDEGTDFLVAIERLRFDDRIILLAADQGPVAAADTATMREDGGAILIDVLGNDSDADGDRLSIDPTGFTDVLGGTVSVVDGQVRFVADADFNGTARFTYTIVSDLGGLPVYDLAGRLVSPATTTATVTIDVAAVNDLPTGGVILDGTAVVGQVLTATNTLADADGMGTVSYQWQRGVPAGEGIVWQDIAGATGETYTLATPDGGAEIRAVARYTDDDGTPESVASGAMTVEPGDNGGGFRMLDMNLFAGNLEQYNNRAIDFALVAEGATNWFSVTFELLQDDGIINFFEGAWAWVNVSTGAEPGGQILKATFLAIDTESGATDEGTLTLRRLDGSITGYELSGGDGADVFLPPNGDGTIRGGAGDDVVLALSIAGDLVALGETGFDSLQVEGLVGNLVLDGGADADQISASGVTGSVELRGGTGNDVLTAFGNTLGATMDGGAGADGYVMAPGPAGNTIILRKGETAGDWISGFDGAAGDRILLVGFQDSVLPTQGATPSEWRVTAADGTEELFNILSDGFVASRDVLWA